MTRDETGRRGLLADDVDYVLAIEVARIAEEGLLAFIMVVLAVLEVPIETSHREARQLRCDRPACKRAGALEDIGLSVVALPHAEQFEKLAAPVLVRGVCVVLVIVQPVDHRRVLGNRHQDILVVAHALLAEHVNHVKDFVPVVHL